MNRLTHRPTHRPTRRLAALVLVACLLAPQALAKAPAPISTFKDWTAYTVKEKGGLACYMASQPKESVPKGVKRGQIWVLVTHRPYKTWAGRSTTAPPSTRRTP